MDSPDGGAEEARALEIPLVWQVPRVGAEANGSSFRSYEWVSNTQRVVDMQE